MNELQLKVNTCDTCKLQETRASKSRLFLVLFSLVEDKWREFSYPYKESTLVKRNQGKRNLFLVDA